jgi:hypothetical protein
MATIAQKTSEFIIRGETHIAVTYLQILEKMESGEKYLELLYNTEDLFRFLIELQSLSQQWTNREILKFIDYWDNENDLKSLAGSIPDVYNSYTELATIVNITNTVVVPAGVGILYQDVNGVISLKEDATIINSNYGLE